MYLVTFAAFCSAPIVTLGTAPVTVRPRNITRLFTGLNTSTPFSTVRYLIVCVATLYSPYLPPAQGITVAAACSASGSLASGLTISGWLDFHELIYSFISCPVRVYEPVYDIFSSTAVAPEVLFPSAKVSSISKNNTSCTVKSRIKRNEKARLYFDEFVVSYFIILSSIIHSFSYHFLSVNNRIIRIVSDLIL